MTSGHRVEVPRWVGIALAITLVPDFDFFLPWFTHRGMTHSLAAAVCLGVVLAVAVTVVKWDRTPNSSDDSSRRALLGFTVGAGSVVGHLIGDLITPMGIRPFFPVDSVYTLNLVYAKDIEANLALIATGIVVFWTVYRWSNDPVPTNRATSSDLATESEPHSFSP